MYDNNNARMYMIIIYNNFEFSLSSSESVLRPLEFTTPQSITNIFRRCYLLIIQKVIFIQHKKLSYTFF